MRVLIALLRFLALRLELLADQLHARRARWPVATEPSGAPVPLSYVSYAPTPPPPPLRCQVCAAEIPPAEDVRLAGPDWLVVAITCAACWFAAVPEVLEILARRAGADAAAKAANIRCPHGYGAGVGCKVCSAISCGCTNASAWECRRSPAVRCDCACHETPPAHEGGSR